MPVDQRTLDEVALSRAEYERIIDLLDREPNAVELGLFGALWSEHCGYKNSRPLLKRFPSQGPRVLTTVGAENAGAVDIGDGLAVVFKMESHNHPSAVEPYQGAATGVGGIVRDIFAMGARPIAILDALRFGKLDDARQRYLFENVVGGISGYGNCLGIPTVGGEVQFDDAYAGNPLVNALCVGIISSDGLLSARAGGIGNPYMLVGADTGRDGIHGASGLASRTDPTARFEEMRPAVQVGNPFLEKLLMEACLELAGHREWFVGLQDLGAAGLTSSAIECAYRGETGLDIDVALVPRREQGMTPYEVMLSESQERMLVIAHKEHGADVRALFERWELHCVTIGHVTDDGMATIRDGDTLAARVPIPLLAEAPTYTREPAPSPDMERRQGLDLAAPADTRDPGGDLLRLLASPNVTSRRWIYRQYDHQVGTNTVILPGQADAAVLRVRGSGRGIAIATDGNGRLVALDPFEGGKIAIAEAARNVVCVGAEPVACTDCLNYGDPERPEVYYQLSRSIDGMAEAARTLGTPVISGNVSLYNESGGVSIHPTPIIGVLGLLEDVERRCTMAFRQTGDIAYLLGTPPSGDAANLAGSEYQALIGEELGGRPRIDLVLEARLQRATLAGVRSGLIRSAHDCSDGGLAVALAECCIASGLGLDAPMAAPAGRTDAFLFGEAQSRIVVSVAEGGAAELEALAQEHDVPLLRLGAVGGDRLRLAGLLDLAVAQLRERHEQGLPEALAGSTGPA